MDGPSLRQAAERLDRLLQHYAASDGEARSLQDSLSRLIAAARAGELAQPLEWRDIPGASCFTEGGLARYGDLETAYADFRIEITGGESPALRNLRSGGVKPNRL